MCKMTEKLAMVTECITYLQAMSEVAVGVGEVGLQLEGGSVGLDGLGDVSGVLVDGGEVRVGICEDEFIV